MPKYIHEFTDWPRLSYQESVVYTELLRTVRLQGEIVGNVRSLGYFAQNADAKSVTLSVLVEDAIQTSAIEGEMLDPAIVRSAVARRLGIDAVLPGSVDPGVEGLVAMLMDATGEGCQAPLTPERIWGWHAALFPTGYSGFDTITVGAWRPDAIHVVSGPEGKRRIHFSGPDAGRVPLEMERFLNWFNAPASREMLLIKSALAHLWFVTIHPLEDGNGRITRALSDMLLARSDNLPGRFYSLSSQIAQERDAYYAALETAQKGTLDVTDWVVWYLGCLGRAVQGSTPFISKALRKANFWRKWGHIPLNDRQNRMLNRLLDDGWKGNLDAARWGSATHVSRATSMRDIQELVKEKVLVELGGGRSTRYELAE